MSMPDQEIAMSDEESAMSDSGESTMSDYHSAVSYERNDTSGRVFCPHIARAVGLHVLGKPIRLRIDLQECRGLPEFETSSDGYATRASYKVDFVASPSQARTNRISSSYAQESRRSSEGTVQWDEILYLECFERSILKVQVFSSTQYLGEAYRLVADLLTMSGLQLDRFGDASCTLYLSASVAHASNDDDENGYNMQIGSSLENQHGQIQVDPGIRPAVPTACIANSLYTIISQLSLFMEAVYQLKAPFDDTTIFADAYHIQVWTYDAYKASLSPKAYHPRVHTLIASMELMMTAMLPRASTYLQRRSEYVDKIMFSLSWWASDVFYLVENRQLSDGASTEHPEAELARLTILIVTPDPTCGVNSTSASSNRHTISGIIAKDTLLFVLEGIVQSSDAFPPLKSAASGLLYFATSAEMASSNKKQVRDIYKRIDGLAASLRRGAPKGSPLTPEHQEVITSLAEDIATLNEELSGIVAERKNRFKRFFGAKRHRSELQDIVTQLDNTRMNYMMAMATLNATTNANVFAHVQAYSVVLGTGPVYAPGTRRADAITFPFNTSRLEEV